MIIPSYLLCLFGAALLIQAVHTGPPYTAKRSLPPRGRPLKQATRAQIVNRATKPRLRRQVASVQPYPQCADYAATGPVPYARWNNLDYDAAEGAVLYNNIATREQCIKICELAQECVVSTYNKNTLDCFKATRQGTFFLANFEATVKGVTCESSTAVIEQYRDASCCTEYRAATPV